MSTSHHLDVAGGTLYYEVCGSGPLLLIIGQPMTAAPFAPLADLMATDHTVVTYDPHGLGQSTVEDPSLTVTPEVHANDLARLVEAVGGGPADIFASSGGAISGLAFAAHRPDLVGTLVAHEPPVTDLLPDAEYVRVATDDAVDAFRAYGSGAAWGKFVSLVMHQGPVTESGITPATWTPPPAEDGAAAEDQAPPPEPSAKQLADDELFFLHILRPFTRYQPEIEQLGTGSPRIVIGVGAASGPEIARRSAEALADQLDLTPAVFPGDHGGFMSDPPAFAATLRSVLAATPAHV